MGQIYNISSALPFFESLAKGVLERNQDLANFTIYLPNRRAERPLAESILRQSQKKAIILPKIEIIGDVDEEDLYIKYFPDFEKIPQAISPTARLYQIARLINHKDGGSFIHSLALAKSLIQLIDELQNKNVPYEKLNDAVAADFAAHWQITLDFLKVVAEDWQHYLQQHNLLEPISRRNLLIEQLAAYYLSNGLPHPVIIAGTTGSIPSTVKLIQAVCKDQKGCLVLDGLDRNLSNEVFDIIEETHPQYNFAKLLKSIAVNPDEVDEWENVEITHRQKLISTALYPTELTSEWRSYKNREPHPVKDLHLIEAANIEEEALAVAIALRETLEEPGKSAMVVTNNSALRERITAKMRMWNVEINDTAGQRLIRLPTPRFLLELAEMLRSGQAPVELLSFFKHPYIPAELKARIRDIELEHLHQPRLLGFKISDFGVEVAGLEGLAKMLESQLVPLARIFDLHLQVAENIATREQLWKGWAGLKVYEYLRDVRASIDEDHEINPEYYPEILAQFFSNAQAYRPPYNLHPQVNIFSPAEARMQTADKVIIVGMNEGSFPELSAADSFLNLEIRKKIGLDSMARKIGQAAHDFELLSQAPCVIYTRSIKERGSPAIKSRFLQRLEAIATLAAGNKYCAWAAELNNPGKAPEATPKPAPKPPLAARPKKLSATSVGRMMRDPYVIYADKILRLKKLDPIDAEVTADKFGSFIHRALELFMLEYDGKIETLLEIGRQEFSGFENRVGAKTFWWPKFINIAEWFISNEHKRTGSQVFVEDKGSVNIGGINFTAEADRLDIGDEIKIIDYKTGTPPGFDYVAAGLDPQLAIEAIIFTEKYKKKVTALEYWYLVGRDEMVKQKSYRGSLTELCEVTYKGLENLAAALLNEETPFIARPWSRYALPYNDYEHLARIKEWDE